MVPHYEDNKKVEDRYDLFSLVGPVKYRLLECLTKEKIYTFLQQYDGLRDITCPKILRKMFRDFIDYKYPFKPLEATFSEETDLDNLEDIRKDIGNFTNAMRRFFIAPKLDTIYYPYGVEVRYDPNSIERVSIPDN